MVSLRAGQTLVGMMRVYANSQRRRRYWYWLGLALGVVFTIGTGVELARAMRDTSSPSVVSVSAASFDREVPMAPNSIVAAFGLKLATSDQVAYASDDDPNTPGIQLPTRLGGTTVQVNGKFAGLLFVSKGQINYVIPEDTAPGLASIEVKAGDGAISTGTAQIDYVSPAIFTANVSGRGVPAAILFRSKSDGVQTYESILQLIKPGEPEQRFIAKPIDMGPEGDTVFLILLHEWSPLLREERRSRSCFYRRRRMRSELCRPGARPGRSRSDQRSDSTELDRAQQYQCFGNGRKRNFKSGRY